MLKTKLLETLPDERPITSIQVLETLDKCPTGFYPIIKTYDQDQDADLKETSIFKTSSSRYLCLSKSEGLPNFVIKEIIVLNDKAAPPQGFSLLNRTVDSEQKAWRKKQLCYRLVNKRDIKTAVTDIIICSRLRKAPHGFAFAGEINGVTICYKVGTIQESQSNSNGNSALIASDRHTRPSAQPVYPALGDSDHDYEILLHTTGPSVPSKPSHRPLPISHQNSIHTLGNSLGGLDGVPFVINPKFITTDARDDKAYIPQIKAKTMQQILREYDYQFTVERQT